ncbi:putative heavy metal-associated domain, HMA, heavy metal-associated domain superfamily [Helianthus annuus]|uniref:Heavy metal-associated domain, HMA, heavy metal-associated domain superfamily n=1 Tax=Helianthus annuus TaxID=4232 RepID=A0A251T7S8_HELAN|nr:copper transport protein CCH [Helianthus annuus]KAF5770584.1 putative heavy metal-associated domain, HMA, heavy metal-associated domain superfamily [Helianthus annuus]KAJ0465470.1 putative heavy metal-associated domain, HMA, heavy metal-associated domain superfamily [Helianthus annuus]KAJ0487067.1 putative heavy metal-associated domain, HMA, heavy metal-associated domain superfamily [Helianthus annuus]KAJ0661190.1 putative heavy metal-associated domain, HMA, heavy metal-associated domain sup
MSQTVVLKVGMSCGGCAGAVKRVLSNMEGVETFDIDLEQKKVTVKGNVEPDAVLQTVSKTGKKTEFWPKEASPCCCGPKKTVEPVAAPSSEAGEVVETVVAPSCGAAKPVESVAAPSCGAAKPVEPVAAPSCGATKPVDAPSSEAAKPVEPVAAPSSEAEKPVETVVA